MFLSLSKINKHIFIFKEGSFQINFNKWSEV